MSEKLHQPSSHEVQRPNIDAAAESRKNIERIKELAGKETSPTPPIEQLKEAAAEKAISGKEIGIAEQQVDTQPLFNQRELKQDAFNKTMQKVRSQLSPVERGFSRFIHHKSVDAISTFSGKTIARPSGVLGGGVFACVGSSIILYFARTYGFSYNYMLLLLLFLAGFCMGIALEAFMKLLSHEK